MGHAWSEFYWLKALWPHLGPPAELSDEEKRAMKAAVELGETEHLTDWLKEQIEASKACQRRCLSGRLHRGFRQRQGGAGERRRSDY